LTGLSGLVIPVIAPFSTDQNPAAPTQPSRSLPLNMGTKPSSLSAADKTGQMRQGSNKTRKILVGMDGALSFMVYDGTRGPAGSRKGAKAQREMRVLDQTAIE
jgi:hypothetical protein